MRDCRNFNLRREKKTTNDETDNFTKTLKIVRKIEKSHKMASLLVFPTPKDIFEVEIVLIWIVINCKGKKILQFFGSKP